MPGSTVYGLQFNIDFIENISLKIAYDLGTSFNKNLKGQMLGFDFYKDLSISSGSREYYLVNSKYLKKFTTMNIKYFGGLVLSYYEIEIEEDSGRIHKISYPSISYNVKFDLTGRKCDVWAENKLTSCGS